MINKLLVLCYHVGVFESAGPSPGLKKLRRRSMANEGSSEAASDAECGWVGTVEERAKHLQNDCGYTEVECSTRAAMPRSSALNLLCTRRAVSTGRLGVRNARRGCRHGR
eukprot:837551-Rhodomonas_salina.1